MKIVVERELKANKYEFDIEGKNLHSEVNYTFGVLLRRIKIYNECGVPVYIFKQTNFLFKIIMFMLFWILPDRSCPQYKFFDEGIYKGESAIKMFTPQRIVIINNHEYELYLHSNNYVSIMKDKIQVGLIKKNNISILEKNKYLVFFDEKKENDILLVLLLVTYTDIIYFPKRFRFNYYYNEKSIGVDMLYDRTLWRPKT